MKKLFCLLLSLSLIFTLAACGDKDGNYDATNESGSSQGGSDGSVQSAKTEIYFLNFKPEVGEIYKAIADDYKKETGVTVKVVTAASDTYEQTLTSEIAKSNPPTIFQINGPIGYENWKNYCADLKSTKLYSILGDKSLAISSGGGVWGIPYVVEGYGIIYNEEITDKYFALETKATDFKSMDEINSFSELKELCEDMQKNKESLGIDGVFASTSFSPGNQWRWNTHLLNVPFEDEMDEIEDYDNSTLAGLESDTFNFTNEAEFKNIFDLYLNNSVIDKKLIGSKSVNDSMSEFALGKAAMVQNGSWAYAEISQVDGNKVKSDKVKMLPIYMGLEGEEDQGICIGTENYFAINSKASEEKQKASADFLYWLFSSETGKRYVTEELGFITPFETLSDAELSDPLAREVLSWSNKDDIDSVPWAFIAFPGTTFKDTVGNALLEYAQGTKPWEETVNSVKKAWQQAKSE